MQEQLVYSSDLYIKSNFLEMAHWQAWCFLTLQIFKNKTVLEGFIQKEGKVSFTIENRKF